MAFCKVVAVLWVGYEVFAMSIDCNRGSVMWTKTMGMVYERVGIVCEAVGRSMSPTRGSCGGSGQTARARGSSDSKRSLLADEGGESAQGNNLGNYFQ